MLQLIAYLLLNKNRKEEWFKSKPSVKKIPLARFFLTALMLTALMFPISYAVFAQSITLNYKVMQSGNEIGWLKLHKNDSGSTTFITFESEAKKRLVLMLSIKEQQAAIFRNGLMMQSYVYRKVNNDVKVSKYTVNQGDYYLVNNKASAEKVMINGIEYDVLSMYFTEPINRKQVYSDNYQCFLNIENLGDHSYKVKLPDGDANYYYYTNGACTKIKVAHTLFSVEFILSQ